MRRCTVLFCFGLAFVISFAADGHVAAGEPVVVGLKGGKMLEADIDARTNTSHLWLRFTAGYTEVLRPVAWDHITHAIIGAKDLDAKAFRVWALPGGDELVSGE